MLTTKPKSPAKAANPRIAYGEALVELAAENRRIVALDADLCKSTMTVFMQDRCPDHFIEMGIAEQNMASTAAGLALAGMIPFINSFAVFVTGRSYDQIRQAICLPRLNVKIVGSSAGLSDFGDGATHQSVEDISLMRSIPNMTVISPCDALEVKKAVRAMVDYDGPVYLRLSRSDMPAITDENTLFEIGRLLRVAEGDDVAIFATGLLVAKALEARSVLRQIQVSARVINVSTLKPLEADSVLHEVEGVKCVLTAEEHTVIGGLGSAVAEALRRKPLPLEFVGIRDSFGISGTSHEELMVHYGLTAEAIVNAVKELLTQ
jgi:transketolase